MKKTYLPPVSQSLYLQMEELIAISNFTIFITPTEDPAQDADNLLDPGSTSITW